MLESCWNIALQTRNAVFCGCTLRESVGTQADGLGGTTRGTSRTRPGTWLERVLAAERFHSLWFERHSSGVSVAQTTVDVTVTHLQPRSQHNECVWELTVRPSQTIDDTSRARAVFRSRHEILDHRKELRSGCLLQRTGTSIQSPRSTSFLFRAMRSRPNGSKFKPKTHHQCQDVCYLGATSAAQVSGDNFSPPQKEHEL